MKNVIKAISNLFKKENGASKKYDGKKEVYINKGDKFYWSDLDLWHIVGLFNDENDILVIYKSWSKYKQRWVYNVMKRENFIYNLSIMHQLVVKGNHYEIKANKSFE